MAAPITELVLHATLIDGLGAIKTDPTILDDIFGKFLEGWANTQFGQSKIDSIKTYFANNQIRVVHAWGMVPMNTPCFSIQLIAADETPSDQNLGNEYLDFDETVTPTVIATPVTPLSYDPISGKMTVASGVDLSGVAPGMNFVDNDGVVFSVSSPISNLSGNKYVTIGSGMSPVLNLDGRIESSIDFSRTERKQIRIREMIRIGVHSKDDIHLTKFLYYILQYIMKSRQTALINRGVELDRGTGSVFDRADEYEGENIFSRFLDVNCLTEFIWNEDKAQVFDSFEADILVNKPNPNSPNASKYNTSD